MFRSDLLKKRLPEIDVPKKDIMMCLNESDLDPFQTIKDKFLQKMEDVHLNRYFSDITDKLFAKLANYIGDNITKENILIGNGADDMLYAVFNSVRENNDSFAVSLAPSYFDYKTYASAVGLGVKFLDLDNSFDFDADEYIKLTEDENCKLAILCQPNNPTGKLMSDEKLLYILDNITDKLVLIDETYFEFSGKTYVNYLERYPNLVIVRSFSKAFSSAGLRFGYLISSKNNCENIQKGRLIFFSSILIQTFALTILENKEMFLNHTKKVIEERENLYKKLKAVPQITTYTSETNFLIFTIGENSSDLFEYISKNDLAIRNVGAHPIMKNHLRVTISNPENNQKFLNLIEEFLEKKCI